MPGMPYHLEKGPVLSVLEDLLHKPASTLAQVLARLRDPTVPLAEVGGLDSTTLNVQPYPTLQSRIDHLERDWFGFAPGTQAQEPFDLANHRTTGKWESYYGDVAAIVRATFIRAIEVSLGLDHGEDPPGTRHWPIELFWKCPNPWFEGWVTWRRDPTTGHGQVTLVLATPGNGALVHDDPRAGRSPQVDPDSPSGDQGMWVITHKGHKPHLVSTTMATAPGVLPLPTLGTLWEGKPGLTTVAPSFADGGASPNGLAYLP
jgi:hypothetical protein